VFGIAVAVAACMGFAVILAGFPRMGYWKSGCAKDVLKGGEALLV
jgi:hypothetical protein